MYFCRLNTDAINPLLNEAYNVNTKLNNEGILTKNQTFSAANLLVYFYF